MKAVLVLDEMPEKCENCQFHRSRIGTFNEGDNNVISNYGIELCGAENPSKPIARYLEENKPNWCPLRELPDKLTMDDYDEHVPEDLKKLLEYYNDGFNNFLDQILGEED